MKTILWTGGFDSTALVIRAITAGETFSTISFSLGNNTEQAASEKVARSAIREMLNSLPRCDWRSKIELELPCFSLGRDLQCPQPVLWAILPLLMDIGNEIEVGWVRGDDVWHFKHELWATFTNASGIIRSDSPKLTAPFEWDTKEDLLAVYDKLPVDPLLLMSRLSVSERGESWVTSSCNKSVEMRKLWDLMKTRVAMRTPSSDAHFENLVEQGISRDLDRELSTCYNKLTPEIPLAHDFATPSYDQTVNHFKSKIYDPQNPVDLGGFLRAKAEAVLPAAPFERR